MYSAKAPKLLKAFVTSWVEQQYLPDKMSRYKILYKR